MSIFDKIKNLISIEEEEDEALDTMVPTGSAEKEYGSFYGHAGKNKVVNIHTTTQLQVVLVKPERYESATEIADHLKERRTVVVNLESTNKEAARRILDFLTGVTYANDGNFKRVSNGTYIITPYNVDLKGDLIDELENNGVYF
ncbi:MAG: cell division protein SepF [Ruminococcaceae bacterium]|nr:cell division protein SepF [Oscillospiraceae bacterium]